MRGRDAFVLERGVSSQQRSDASLELGLLLVIHAAPSGYGAEPYGEDAALPGLWPRLPRHPGEASM
jgi:hypothetical protein